MSERSDWLAHLLASLQDSGPEALAAAGYIREKRVLLGFHAQPTGARWVPGRRIDLHPRYLEGTPDAVYPLSLIIHEVRHLQQGPLTALSVYGELEAWQAQFGFIKSRSGRYHEIPDRDRLLAGLMSLPLGWDRAVLGSARKVMKKFGGRSYRIDLLPLYPLPREVVWAIGSHEPGPPRDITAK